MRTILITGMLLLLAATTQAADLSGKWSGDVPGRGGDTTPATFHIVLAGGRRTDFAAPRNNIEPLTAPSRSEALS